MGLVHESERGFCRGTPNDLWLRDSSFGGSTCRRSQVGPRIDVSAWTGRCCCHDGQEIGKVGVGGGRRDSRRSECLAISS